MASRGPSQAAADWAARLAGEPGEVDWLEFERWLDAAPEHRQAYDRILALSLEIDRSAPALAELTAEADAAPARAPARRQAPAAWWGAGLMSVAAVAVAFAALHPKPAAEAEVYATAKGERREIVLSDGTHVALNAASRISAAIGRERREITLASGEAAFQVKHDARRPFTVHVGDRVLRDIGTEFDVQRQNGLITVTVREGMVAVQRASGGEDAPSLSLGPGGRFEHREGAGQSTVLAANADDAFSWRSGRLIYRNRPLTEVAADLERYGDDQVRVQGAAASLRFTGVLTIDNQPAMVERLTELLPVASRRKDGVIQLSELNSGR